MVALRGLFGCALALVVASACGGPASPEGPIAKILVNDRPLQFDTCASGDRINFYGVDLSSSTEGTQLRIVEDPIHGLLVRIRAPAISAKPIILGSEQCEVLQGEIKRTGWRINSVRVYDGALSMRCALPDNVRIEGQMSFTFCS